VLTMTTNVESGLLGHGDRVDLVKLALGIEMWD
jgi:hypothetical protein